MGRKVGLRKTIMTKNNRFIASSLIALLLSSVGFLSPISKANAFEFENCCCPINFTPYIGVDAAVRYFNGDNVFGANVFYKNYPEADIYLGFKFGNYFGIEGGYKATITQTKTSSITTGSVVNVPVVNPPEVHRGVSNFKAWFGQLVGFFPIFEPYCIYWFGSVGLSHTTLYAQDKVVNNETESFDNDVNVRTFTTNKVIPNIGTGIQFKIDERSSLRFGVKWENTSQFSNIAAQENFVARLSFKDSVIFSLGFLVDFF